MKQNTRMPVFRDNLRELMGDLSVTDFAQKLGLSRQTVGFYLNGNRIPDCETLVQICNKCEVSANWLLGLSESKSPDPKVAEIMQYTGLSEKSVTVLHGAVTEPSAKASLDGLNLLIEKGDLLSTSAKVQEIICAIQSDAKIREYSFLASVDIPLQFNDKFQLDKSAEYFLEEKIEAEYPELTGRLKIYCGAFNIEEQLKEITESFETTVKLSTGYFDYWHNVLDLDKGDIDGHD